mmetsp:Transcript_4486/g.11210  ORF Transcript_4486/g.11210 Transcript_4486/m.11210 type:complete len:80 (+) Transcript_4486:1511-1750(+)
MPQPACGRSAASSRRQLTGCYAAAGRAMVSAAVLPGAAGSHAQWQLARGQRASNLDASTTRPWASLQQTFRTKQRPSSC